MLGKDRKSTRLNSSHGSISYAVFCLKKKKKTTKHQHRSNCRCVGVLRTHSSRHTVVSALFRVLPNTLVSRSFTWFFFFFFFNDTATTEIYPLSLHDALPISPPARGRRGDVVRGGRGATRPRDRKSTRLNSSHGSISYAVLCFEKTIRSL